MAMDIFPKNMDPEQLAAWCGILEPYDRWRINAFMYFLKALHHPNKSLLHEWIQEQWQFAKLPYFEHFRHLRKLFLGHLYNHELRWETHNFTQVKKDAVGLLAGNAKDNLVPGHLLRDFDWCIKGGSSYMMLKVDELKKYEKDMNITRLRGYYELFYNWGGNPTK